MPSERDKESENSYEAPKRSEQRRFPRWMLIVALVAAGLIAALAVIPATIILATDVASDLQRLFFALLNAA